MATNQATVGDTMALHLEDTVERIERDFGIHSPDAALYVHLCIAGPAKVSDLADALHVHRNDVYRTTERLVERGLVQATMERPTRFVAITPDQIFEDEIAKRLSTVEQLRKSRTEVMSLVEHLQAKVPEPPKGVQRVIQGRRAIHAARDQLVQSALSTIDWASSYLPSVYHADLTGALEHLGRRSDEGVEVRALLRTDANARTRLQPLRVHPHVALKEFDVDLPVRFLIVDGKELLMWVANDPSESVYATEDVAIHTTAPGFVMAQQQFAKTAWASAEDVRF